MSGEPKTLTPEQVVDLAKKYMIAYLEETSWPDELREKWPEELDADYRLLFEEGVRVVARDEATELRAAVKEWAWRMDESRQPRWWEQPSAAVTDRMAAEANLRRLAGGKEQE